MLLRFTVGFSILFIFFIELNIDTFIKNYTEDFERIIETNARTQAWRNLNTIEHSLNANLKYYKEMNIPITREIVFNLIDDYGQSFIGSNSGNIFVLDLEYNSLFYTNNVDFKDVKFIKDKKFIEEDIYALTKKSGGDIDSVKKAWNNELIYKADNLPTDRVSWNITGEEKWLVCKILPSITNGFNNHNSTIDNAFQIKVCQTINKRDILKNYDPVLKELITQKNFIVYMIRGLVALFLISVISDFVIRRYKWRIGKDRRKYKFFQDY